MTYSEMCMINAMFDPDGEAERKARYIHEVEEGRKAIEKTSAEARERLAAKLIEMFQN